MVPAHRRGGDDMGVLRFIVNEVLSQPAYLIGIMALVGLLALRKPAGAVLTGTAKTIVGFLILTAGASLVIATLSPLGGMVQAVFNAHGVVPTNEAVVVLAMKSFGKDMSLIMVLGFLANLLLARITPAKYVFLSGHLLLYLSAVLAATMSAAGIPSIHRVVLGAIIAGTMATALPALLQPFTRRVTNNADFAIGHMNTLGFLVASLVGKLVGRGSKSLEETHVSEKLSFLQQPIVTTSLVMVLLYVILAIFAGPEVLNQYSGGRNYVMYAVAEGLMFGAAIAVIMYGLQMMLGELVPAFKGIAFRLIPRSMPALDCPAIFPYAPTSMLVGFISSAVGGLVGMFLMRPLGLALVIPGMIAQFFDGGAAGIYGNATGGRRGAVLGSFVNGFLITLLPALVLPFLGSLQAVNATFADTDLCWAGILSGVLSRMGVVVAYVGVVVFAGVLLWLASYVTIKIRKVEAE
jgi:PTS system ascorbate-specific IIC component